MPTCCHWHTYTYASMANTRTQLIFQILIKSEVGSKVRTSMPARTHEKTGTDESVCGDRVCSAQKEKNTRATRTEMVTHARTNERAHIRNFAIKPTSCGTTAQFYILCFRSVCVSVPFLCCMGSECVLCVLICTEYTVGIRFRPNFGIANFVIMIINGLVFRTLTHNYLYYLVLF